jgi:hypothetical protein
MSRFSLSTLLLLAGLAGSASAQTAAPAPAAARPKRAASTGGKSPHETISTSLSKQLNGDRVMIVYGRPFSADPRTGEIRKIWGQLVGVTNPYGKVWRMGSDEATILITQKPIMVGDISVPAGAFTLWGLPAEDGSLKLIVNKDIGQWGIDPKEPSNAYNAADDVGRTDFKKDSIDNRVDQLTLKLAGHGDGTGLLTLTWENTQYSVPITEVK